VKDFVRFYIATSHPQIRKIPTSDSINSVVEWFFGGFTRVIGTETVRDDRSEAYNVSSHIPTPLDRPILRKCTKPGGVLDEPMPQSAYRKIQSRPN